MEKTDEQLKDRSKSEGNRPLPNDFDEYLPWACNQMQVEAAIVTKKVYQNEYVSIAQTERSIIIKPQKQRVKSEPSKAEFDYVEKEESYVLKKSFIIISDSIKIDSVYDSNDNLVELRFDKNNETIIPRKVFRVIGLIINFHVYLTAITINRGLNNESIHELSKFIPISNITDVCLDNTVISGASYDSLLEKPSLIRQLSLARCRIDDDIVRKIASRLTYPLPSSKTLVILNLSTNRITDVGAKHLAEVLRSNRQLAYLNLTGNLLTDDGAAAILNILIKFPLNIEELISSRNRQMLYFKEKHSLIARLLTELRFGDIEKKSVKKKSSRATPVERKKLGKDGSQKNLTDTTKSNVSIDAMYYEKARNMADSLLNEFKDPFSNTNITTNKNTVYCHGNNALCYINFSYNKLSFLTVKRLYKVLKVQKMLNRSPKGLVNVCIEGNHMPICCKELTRVDDFLQLGLDIALYRRLSKEVKKKPGSKGK